jgi:hypothetical protein
MGEVLGIPIASDTIAVHTAKWVVDKVELINTCLHLVPRMQSQTGSCWILKAKQLLCTIPPDQMQGQLQWADDLGHEALQNILGRLLTEHALMNAALPPRLGIGDDSNRKDGRCSIHGRSIAQYLPLLVGTWRHTPGLLGECHYTADELEGTAHPTCILGN